jgi:hypothetical protein
MTLHEYPDIEQGTPQWDELRRGIVTASVVGKLITPTLKVADNDTSRGLTNQLAAERITGWTDPSFVGAAMERGWEDEPHAVEVYAAHYHPVTTVGFMRRDEDGWTLGYSPDGLVGDVGLIEVKSRAPKIHLRTILAGVVPSENVAQIQGGLLVSGREWCDYVSFCGGMPLYPIRVYPDPDWFAAIEAACRRFEENVNTITKTYEAAVVGLPQTERVLEEEVTF